MATDSPLDAARRSTGALPIPTLIRTPEQRVRVFVSSTLDELAPERAAAREAITQLRLTPVLFESGARPYPPRELYRAYLSQRYLRRPLLAALWLGGPRHADLWPGGRVPACG